MVISGSLFLKEPPPRKVENYLVDIKEPLYGFGTSLKHDISYCLIEFLQEPRAKDYLGQCQECRKYFIATRLNDQKFCSKKCRLDSHNRKRIESGEHARYKRDRKIQGKATPSYYG